MSKVLVSQRSLCYIAVIAGPLSPLYDDAFFSRILWLWWPKLRTEHVYPVSGSRSTLSWSGAAALVSKRNTASGTIEIKKRFCQTKYFILGSTNFLSLPPVLQNRTDNICKDMLNLFNNLSEDGKHGADKKQTQLLFNETMSTFSQVLDLREHLYS